jgi:hypothetical protein
VSIELGEFFARARSAADSIETPRAADVRRRGDRRRRRQTTIVVCSVFVILAATLSGVMLKSRERAMPHPATTPRPVPTTAPKGFATLHQVGSPIQFGAAGRQSAGSLLIDNGEGFAAWRTAQPDRLVVAGFNTSTGKKYWGPTKIDAQGEWYGLTGMAETVVGTVIAPEGTQPPKSYWFLSKHDGSVRWHTSGRLLFASFGGGPQDLGVVIEARGGDLVGRSLRDGHTLWRLRGAAAPGMHAIPDGTQDEMTTQGGLRTSLSWRFLVQEPAGQVRYYDSRSGQPTGAVLDLAGRTVIGGFDGALYAISQSSPTLELTAITDGRITTVYKGESPQPSAPALTRCFTGRACFVDGDRIIVLDPHTGATTTITADFPPARIAALSTFGILVSAASQESATPYALFDIKGERVGAFLAPGGLDLVTVVNGAVLMPAGAAGQARSAGFTALMYDGTTGSLGQIPVAGPCAVTADTLLCLDESGLGYWSYR